MPPPWRLQVREHEERDVHSEVQSVLSLLDPSYNAQVR